MFDDNFGMENGSLPSAVVGIGTSDNHFRVIAETLENGVDIDDFFTSAEVYQEHVCAVVSQSSIENSKEICY